MITTHSPEEFKYRLAETVRKVRLEHGYETVYDLAAAINLPVKELMALETGNIKSFGVLFLLAKFYGKRIRIDFI
ncbi:MAG: hypothetical protein ACI4TE_06680 [Alphaproteobacteria bacterium]